MTEEKVAQATIQLTDESDAHALSAWLNRAGHFRGLVDVSARPSGPGESPPIVDVVIVGVGRGMLALLVTKIYDWIVLQCGQRVTAIYTPAGGRPLTIEVDRADDRARLIDRVRRIVESSVDP
jgi:Effector Associated Constant Component 1